MRSFKYPFAGPLSPAPAAVPVRTRDSGRQVLSLFDVSDRSASPTLETVPCRAR